MRCDLAGWNRLLLVLALSALGSILGDPAARADSFDWRNVNGGNYMTPMQPQFGGTCWDFRSVAAVGAHFQGHPQ